MSTIAIFGSYVLSRKDGAQEVLRDHWVLLEGKRIAAVTRDRPSANEVFDRPGRFVLPGLMNLHNHCFSEAVARTPHRGRQWPPQQPEHRLYRAAAADQARRRYACRRKSGSPSRGSASCSC